MTEMDGPDLLKTAFAVIAERGWHGFSLAEVARRADVPLASVYAELPTRRSVLAALGRRLDEAMLSIEPGELAELDPRERVFELVMRRLDAMAPFKPGLRVLGRESGLEPDVLGSGCGNVGRAVSWLLDASGVELGGLRRCAAGPVLALVYARVVNVWLRDDTPDLGRTLAELDKRLRQAEDLARWSAWLDRGRHRRGPGPEPEPEAQPA